MLDVRVLCYNIAILFNMNTSLLRQKKNVQNYVVFVSIETVKMVTSMTFYSLKVGTSLLGISQLL